MKRYTLDEMAARKLSRVLRTSGPPLPQRTPGRKSSPMTVVKIEAHEGDGVYQAVEVFWSGAAWVEDADVSREFGAAHSTRGVRHLGGDTEIETGSYVVVFPLHVQSADGLDLWVFGEPGGDDVWHPFKSRLKPGGTDTIEVGYLRAPVYAPADHVTIFDPDDTGQTTQIKRVDDTDPVDSAGLSGDGYLYYLLRRNTTGTWTFDDAGQRPKSSAAWPPTPDARDGIPVLIGTYTDMGSSTAKWWQVLRDDPYIWPRPVQPDFMPIYCTDPTPEPHAAVIVSAGNIRFRSDTEHQEFAIPAQTMDLTATKYYYLEATITPGLTPTVASVAQKVENAYPGYCAKPTKIYYLIGKTDGTRYWPYQIGTLWDGTVFSPKWTKNTFIDAQGVNVWAGNCTAIEGEGAANSEFLEIYKPGIHFRFGDLDQMSDGDPATKIGGTDDDLEETLLSGVVCECDVDGNYRLVFSSRKLTINATSGIVVKNEAADELDTYVNLTGIDVITGIRVNGLSLQYKARRVYVPCFDEEGDWQTWHTGTECEE